MTKADVSKFVNNVKSSLSKHSPEILVGIGITGMVTTTVLAVKATPKALKLIEETKRAERKDKLTPIETVKATWKCYIPTVVTGVSSATCLICANRIHLRRSAALAAAYKISETALTEYREKVIETIGERKEEAVREKLNEKRMKDVPASKNEVVITAKGKTLCFDPLSGRYFKSDIDKIKNAVNELNSRVISYDYASLNDFYDELELPHIELGDDLGWNVDKKLKMEYGATLSDEDEPCIVLEYLVAPKYGYSNF